MCVLRAGAKAHMCCCTQDGMWNGVQVLPEGWVQYSTTPTKAFEKYGAGWWLRYPGEYWNQLESARVANDINTSFQSKHESAASKCTL